MRKVWRPRGHAKLAPTAKRNVRLVVLLDFSPSRLLPTFGRRMRDLTCFLTLFEHVLTHDILVVHNCRLSLVRWDQCLASISTLPTKTQLRPLLDPSAKQIHSVFSFEVQPSPRINVCLSAGGGAKRRYQYCTDISGTIIYLRALQGHSGRNLVDPSLQDNVIIQRGFFQHIYHIRCAFNLHSIINSGLIPGGQNSSKRQTVFFLPIDPRDKGHQDPAKIDLNETRRAQYLHSAWKKHQDAVFWVDINLAIQKGLTFYQTRSNAIILQGTLPAYCIPKVVRSKTGEVLYEKSYMSPRPPPKISSRHDHDWTRGKVQLGSTVDQQPDGKVVRQSRGEVQHATFSQLTQPIPEPICDRSGQPEDTQGVFVVEGETSRSHEIDDKGFHEKLCASDRSWQPEITLSVIEARNLS